MYLNKKYNFTVVHDIHSLSKRYLLENIKNTLLYKDSTEYMQYLQNFTIDSKWNRNIQQGRESLRHSKALWYSFLLCSSHISLFSFTSSVRVSCICSHSSNSCGQLFFAASQTFTDEFSNGSLRPPLQLL